MLVSPLFSIPSILKNQAAPYRSIAELLWIQKACSFRLEEYEVYRCEKQQNEMLIVAIQKGVLNVESDTLHGMVRSGQAFFLPQTERDCTLTADKASEGTIFALSGSAVDLILGDLIPERKVYCPKGLLSILDAAAALQSDQICPEQLSATAYQLLMEIHRVAERYEGKPGYPPLVEAAMAMIQEEFASLDSVWEIAERLGISESHLIRLFSRHIGVSPGRCLKKRRMEYAKELLVQSELPVALIAELTGFSDANYFSKAFRKENGMSPSEYARQYAQADLSEPANHRMLDELYL